MVGFKKIKFCIFLIGSISELNDDQKQLQQSVRKFVADEVTPKAADYDRSMAYPWEIIKKAHALGFLNPDIPEEYVEFCVSSILLFSCIVLRKLIFWFMFIVVVVVGGLGLDMTSSALISEEVAYGCSGIGTAMLVCFSIVLFGQTVELPRISNASLAQLSITCGFNVIGCFHTFLVVEPVIPIIV